MGKEPLLQPDKIHLIDFKIIKGQIESPVGFDPIKRKGHAFQVNFDMGFNLEDKLVKADFIVDITTESEEGQEEEARGMFHFVYVFQVENLEELAMPGKKKEEIQIDGDLANTMASISYSTSRGILITRFQGTALEHFILPVIDPNKLLE